MDACPEAIYHIIDDNSGYLRPIIVEFGAQVIGGKLNYFPDFQVDMTSHELT